MAVQFKASGIVAPNADDYTIEGHSIVRKKPKRRMSKKRRLKLRRQFAASDTTTQKGTW